MFKSFRLICALCIILSIGFSYGVTAAQDDEAIKPTFGKWVGDEIAFQPNGNSPLAGMDAAFKLDFTVAQDQKTVIGVMTLRLAGEQELAIGDAWFVTIEENLVSHTATVPFASGFSFVIDWTGEFVSSDEIEGAVTIKVGPMALVENLVWSAEVASEEQDEEIITGPTSQSISTEKWVADEIEFELNNEMMTGELGSFTFDFEVAETRVSGTALITVSQLVRGGNWHSDILNGTLAAQSVSQFDPQASMYASWAGIFTEPEKLEGIAVVGVSPAFFEVIYWTAQPSQD